MPSQFEQKASLDIEDSNKIYRVLSAPPAARVHFMRHGRAIRPGDYGWEAAQYHPPEKVGRFITLEGSDDCYGIVWLADFVTDEVEFVALKPALTGLNPYAVQKP